MKPINSMMILFGSLSLIGCQKTSFLDKQVEITTEDQVFADSAKATQLLTDCYAYTGQDVYYARVDYINPDYGCLDDLTTLETSAFSNPQANWLSDANIASNAPFNATNTPGGAGYWSVFYRKIRALNLFMKKIPNTPMASVSRDRLIGEARFLRAFYYTSLIRIYGAVQLMGDTVLNLSDVIDSKRNAFKECVDYIVSECDAVTNNPTIPTATDQPADQYGRVTKGMSMSLKARVLLMAASPLYNGHPITTDAALQPLLCYTATLDPTLWQKAADACNAVIQSAQYALVVDNATKPGWGFRQQFLTYSNSEYIFPFMVYTDLENNRLPVSRASRPLGAVYSNPSENLVQMFGMANGKSIGDPSSGYDLNNPYVNRDPRFDYTIVYNQSLMWKPGFATPQPVNIFTGGEDQVAAYNTRTGYFSKKMCDELTPFTSRKNRFYPIIRYAEIILGYAEALNELGRTEEAVTQLNLIRNRAGILPGADGRYGIAMGIDKDDLRKIIQNEYVVELFQEGHWYYDSRRWRTAEVIENRPVQGMNITRTGTAPNYTYTYSPMVAVSAVFTPRMYFQPIPQVEIDRSVLLLQNPGW